MMESKFTVWLQLVLSILVTIAVPVLLVLISVRLVMTDTYLQLEYNKPDFPSDDYGFTLQDRLHYAPFALQYLLGSDGIDYLGKLKFADGRPLYNDRELEHMVDVKNVFRGALLALGVTLLIFSISLSILMRSPAGLRALRLGLFSGGLLMLAILGGLVLMLLINWDAFFDGFHDLFFAAGTWTFDYSDTLIRLFPIRFWQDAALTIGGMSAAGALLLIGGSWWWARRDI
jgi:integral membrane protein (TIGR01906 family)